MPTLTSLPDETLLDIAQVGELEFLDALALRWVSPKALLLFRGLRATAIGSTPNKDTFHIWLHIYRVRVSRPQNLTRELHQL